MEDVFYWRTPEIFLNTFFCFFGGRLKKNFEDLLFIFCLENTCACVLGLEHSCPWPQEGLSSEGLSLASDFFCVLGLEPCVVDSTSGKYFKMSCFFSFLLSLRCSSHAYYRYLRPYYLYLMHDTTLFVLLLLLFVPKCVFFSLKWLQLQCYF